MKVLSVKIMDHSQDIEQRYDELKSAHKESNTSGLYFWLQDYSTDLIHHFIDLFTECFVLTDSEKPSTSKHIVPIDQTGGGVETAPLSQLFNEDVIANIASAVAKKLEPSTSATFRPIISTWNTYERSEPTSTAVVPENTTPSMPYDHKVIKTDLNDQKDTLKVLNKVPKKHWTNAIRLLESFEERSSELSYNCQGTIFVSEEAIPNSNIYELMPYLFKRQTPKLPGFLDFVNKITEMNLQHLIIYRPKEVRLISKISKSTTHSISDTNSNPATNWWYLGP